MKISARNILKGSVSHLEPGTVTQVLDSAVEAEVTIGLPGGAREHAVITHDAVQETGRRKGVPATAVFKPSSVTLGVAG
jgi:molybdate transport system regulatory protein